MLGREVEECHEFLAIFLQTQRRLGILGFVGFDKQLEGLLRISFGLGLSDAVFVKQVVRRFHAGSLISGALVSFSGFNQTGPAGCQFLVFPDQRCGFCARAVA